MFRTDHSLRWQPDRLRDWLLVFEDAHIAVCALRPGHPALVSGWADGVIRGIDGRRAGSERHGELG